MAFDSIEATGQALAAHGYVADPGLVTSLFLATKMAKPLFLEGEPGVGKTELAKVVSSCFQAPLIRLQCYEGLDIQHAVYEWNYGRQLLTLQADGQDSVDDIYSEKYLLRRPLLQAIDSAAECSPVLLIDELDRADEEFESFLLELLAEFQITIPELGTLKAAHKPWVFVTSNRTREVHDALKRRCVYQWIDYPNAEREAAIVEAKVPGISQRLAARVVAFVQALRREDLYKLPGVAESLDWAQALGHLNVEALNPEVVEQTLGFLLKYQDDVDKLRGERLHSLLRESSGSEREVAAG